MAETATKQAPHQAKQPPKEAVAPMASSWVEQAEAYLESKGWEKMGTNALGVSIWQTPNGSRLNQDGERVIKLPQKDGGFETVKQAIIPPIPWRYDLHNAVRIQKATDEGEGAKTPLERLHELEEKFNEITRSYTRLVIALKDICRIPPQSKPEGQALVRGKMFELLGAAQGEMRSLGLGEIKE